MVVWSAKTGNREGSNRVTDSQVKQGNLFIYIIITDFLEDIQVYV